MRLVNKRILWLSVVLAGAANAKVIELTQIFSTQEVAYVKQAGNSTVSGGAFITLENGEQKGCAGFHVELLPAGEYAKQRILHTYGNMQRGQILISQQPPKFSPDVKAYHDYVRKADCDEQDQFRFNDVAAGDYFVIAFIIWKEGDALQGGGVMHQLSVQKGLDTSITL